MTRFEEWVKTTYAPPTMADFKSAYDSDVIKLPCHKCPAVMDCSGQLSDGSCWDVFKKWGDVIINND